MLGWDDEINFFKIRFLSHSLLLCVTKVFENNLCAFDEVPAI
ncbi:hypothetical protein [Staphylococcus arlettae]|nr:hypothetical protein [Staphylococcus arlettae]